jgi:AcrR family transcriptional regulator
MTTLRAQKKRQTRKAILEAAIKLFTEKGFEQTSIEELAKVAGIGKATIYGYFATKQEIYLAFCEEEIDYVFRHMDEEVDPQAPLLEQIVALSMAQFDFVTANREFGRLFCREIAFPRESMADKSRELDARYLARVMEIIQRAQQRGELHEDADPLLALANFHAFYLLVISGWYGGYFATREMVATMLRALCRQSLIGWGEGDPGEVPDQEVMDQIKAPFANLHLAEVDSQEDQE